MEKAATMYPWTKPISPWKLECETDAVNPITRQDAYDRLYNQRFDSKGIVQNLRFMTIGSALIAIGIFF